MDTQSLKHGGADLDAILCYFMETILHIQCNGLAGLPLRNPLGTPYRDFLDAAMGIFLDANPPELARLLLEAAYSAEISRGAVSAEDAAALQMIKELSWHIYYDGDCYGYLLSTINIWGRRAFEYAALVFYPALPQDIREKYHIPISAEHSGKNMA